MTRFLAVFSAILLSTLSAGLFAVSFAHAASSYDNTIHTTDKLLLMSPDGNKTKDITTTYMQEIESCNISRWRDSLQSVVSNQGHWSISLDRWNTQQVVTISWADNIPDLGGSNNGGQFSGSSPDSYFGTPGNYSITIMMQNNESVICGTWDPDQQGVGLWKLSTEKQNENYTSQLFLTTYPVVYPEGYSGAQIPSTVQPGTYPDFGYTVNNDLQLKILYLQNLDISNGYKWSYTIYQSDSDWSPNIEIDSRSLRLNEIYEQQLPAVGNYVVKIHLESPPPLLDRNDIKNIELRITATGNYDVGSTVLNDCVDGVCTQKACVTGSVFDKMSCKLRNQINVGVLNPTINILVSLYQSMTVKQGVCTQLLPDSPSINGQTLPFSQLSTKTCQWSDSIRGNPAFAWVTVMVNLLFAIMIFLGIKNLINKILDNKDDEVIQS